MCKSRATRRALITSMCHATCHLVRRDSSAKSSKVQINEIETLSNLIAELSLRTKWHVAGQQHSRGFANLCYMGVDQNMSDVTIKAVLELIPEVSLCTCL